MDNPPRKRLMIVDDSEAYRRIVDVMLKKDYELHFASSGRQCLAEAAKVNPDLILLDNMMPDLDGIEVCRMLKSDPETARIPVIFISALSSASERYKCLDAGAADYLNKPFDPATLRATVRRNLGE